MNHEGMPVYASEKVVHSPAFFKYSFLTPSRGWQLVAVGDMTKSRTENPFSLIFKVFMTCHQQEGQDTYLEQFPQVLGLGLVFTKKIYKFTDSKAQLKICSITSRRNKQY